MRILKKPIIPEKWEWSEDEYVSEITLCELLDYVRKEEGNIEDVKISVIDSYSGFDLKISIKRQETDEDYAERIKPHLLKLKKWEKWYKENRQAIITEKRNRKLRRSKTQITYWKKKLNDL